MDSETLLATVDFSHNRLLNTLDAVEKTAKEKNVPVGKLLAWRPGPGRAHIAWQFAHCAATHDKYLTVNLLGKPSPTDEQLVKNFGGGSTPSEQNVPDVATIRKAIDAAYEPFRAFVAAADVATLLRVTPGPGGTQRSVAEAISLLAWHEAHHQGQIHLTLNLFKAANP